MGTFSPRRAALIMVGLCVALTGMALASGIYLASRRSAVTAHNVTEVPRPPAEHLTV